MVELAACVGVDDAAAAAADHQEPGRSRPQGSHKEWCRYFSVVALRFQSSEEQSVGAFALTWERKDPWVGAELT